VTSKPPAGAGPRTGRARYAVLLALLLFAVLAASPEILGALHLRSNSLPTVVNGVHLLPAPGAPPQVSLSRVATPIDPGQPPATLPAASAARQAAAVAAEDTRIRLLVHDAASVYQPEVIAVQGSLPTLVLTAGSGAYTYSSLVQYGALVLLPHHAGLLLDNVFVSTNARLNLGGPKLRALYMDSSASGFTSIVGWGGDLYFEGTRQQPMTILGWDRTTNSPAPDAGSGRSYIRDVGGKMVLTDVRASALGFWSGRTGGVAWTGSTSTPSTGGATGTTFTDETYGAFVTRGKNIKFSDDLFEFNELDGLHIHRDSVGTSVSGSSSARNGGNGFLVDRATNNTVLTSDVAVHNAGDGFLIDGRPLVTGASASGGSVAADTGTYVQHSEATGNLQSGIVLEGGSGTVLRGDEVCARLTGIAIRDGATNTIVTGNDVRCNPRAALEIGPGAPGSMISGNTLVGARVGMLIRTSGPVVTDSNRIIGATVFGITARGSSSHVSGQDNVISGTGFRAVDARADAAQPALSGTQDKGWLHQVNVTVWSWLIFHPLALLWLSILLLVILGEIWSRLRRMPPHPYPASTHWRGDDSPPAAVAAATALLAGFGEPAGVPAGPAPQPAARVAEAGERLAVPEKITAGARGPVSFVDEPVAMAAEPVTMAGDPTAMPREPVPAAGEPVTGRAPVSFVDLPVQPTARRPGAHRPAPAAPRQASERPPESRPREQPSPPPRRPTAEPQPPSSPGSPGRSGSRDWFTPPVDPPPSRQDQPSWEDRPARRDRPFRLDRPPRADSDVDARYWAEWPVPPPVPPPPPAPPDDLGESMDTRPFPVVEGLCDPR
jgi:hypothetical protein